MLRIQSQGVRLCDGMTRRDILHMGGLGAFGLGLPSLLAQQSQAANVAAGQPRSGKAKSCIVLFMLGGPPQHSTWDPKPDAPAEIRGQFGPIASSVPGIQFSELLPHMAGLAHHLCILRAVSTNDNAHSSSGYFMMTGHPHVPMNFENANPGPPNDRPCWGGVVEKMSKNTSGFPSAITLPHRIFNTDGSVWPGQTAGMLGKTVDPWLFQCVPGAPDFRINQFAPPTELPLERMAARRSLLGRVNDHLDGIDRANLLATFDHQTQQAFDLLRSPRSRQAFRLDLEPASVRERYGDSPFGQSVLLSRRLVEAGVSLVQVNWYRGPDEPSSNPCWDSHADETNRLKNVLVPPLDRAFSALLEDLLQRGMLDETLVICMAEFGRTPKFNRVGGRDHWGHVFSIALGGGGIRGGQVIGASDKVGGYPIEGKVAPADLSTTVFHCLGIQPDAIVHDTLGRPIVLSHGEVISRALA